jgi:hypothetical protein
MKDDQLVQQFITLRAQGVSFARLAGHLGVSKPAAGSAQFVFRYRNGQVLVKFAARRLPNLSLIGIAMR